jgi:1-deoxyxylulose-5-phosphate synthase
MRYVSLGATGLRVSRVCLGMMGFGNNSDRPWVIDEDGAEPLARGILAGSRSRDGERRTTRSETDAFADHLYRDADFDVVDRVVEVAGGRGVPAARVALAWLLHRPGVTAPIVGATKLGHLEDALAAEDLDLSDKEMQRLEEPYVPHPVLGHQ